jgi:S-formylglutathione hydrolase FrmB
MAFAQLHWFSQVLGRQTTTWVLLPEQGTGPFATFYLLHGLGDDHTIWLRRTRLEVYVAGQPLIVVMPDGGRGFYANHHDGGTQWATHVGVELPGMIERTFPALPTRDGRFIGGLSMGGYGALRVALGHPDRFASATSHSGAVLGPGRRRDIPPSPEWKPIVGPTGWEQSGNDLAPLAVRAKTGGMLPRMRIDCGVDDFLLEDNRTFHRQLEQAGVPHDYLEYPGGHTWEYWDTHVKDAIQFHAHVTV